MRIKQLWTFSLLFFNPYTAGKDRRNTLKLRKKTMETNAERTTVEKIRTGVEQVLGRTPKVEKIEPRCPSLTPPRHFADFFQLWGCAVRPAQHLYWIFFNQDTNTHKNIAGYSVFPHWYTKEKNGTEFQEIQETAAVYASCIFSTRKKNARNVPQANNRESHTASVFRVPRKSTPIGGERKCRFCEKCSKINVSTRANIVIKKRTLVPKKPFRK